MKYLREDSIIKNSLLISIVVCLGKILGFLKQSVIAWAYGSNGVTDVYFAADGYVATFGQIFLTSISPVVLTAYLSDKRKKGEKEANELISSSFIFFGFVGLISIVISLSFLKQICRLIGVSYTDSQINELEFYLITLLPVMLFTSIGGVSQGYLDAENKYIYGKCCSFFFSIAIICSVFLFKKSIGLDALLYGFLAGYFLYTLFICVVVVKKIGFRIRFPIKNESFMFMLKGFFPLMFGNAIVEMGFLVDKIVASSLQEGSVSNLYYGHVVGQELVHSVVVTTVGTVLLTTFSKKVLENENSEIISQSIRTAICTMTFILGLIMSLYIVCGKELIRFLFERGSFSSNNTEEIYSIAVFYSVGFIFMGWREILVKAHFAYKDTKNPMLSSLIGVGINIFGSIWLSKYWGLSGIALATSFSYMVSAVVSTITIRKHTSCNIIDRVCIKELIKQLLVIFIVTFLGYIMSLFFGEINFILRMMLVSAVIVLAYILLGIALKINCCEFFLKKALKKKNGL